MQALGCLLSFNFNLSAVSGLGEIEVNDDLIKSAAFDKPEKMGLIRPTCFQFPKGGENVKINSHLSKVVIKMHILMRNI